MSHTDKTRPAWVQILDSDNRGWRQERHNHRDGICDLPEPVGREAVDFYMFKRWLDCHWDYSAAAHASNSLWCRYPRKGGRDRLRREGRARAAWRAMRDSMLALPREDMEDVDGNWLRPNQRWLSHKWD